MSKTVNPIQFCRDIYKIQEDIIKNGQVYFIRARGAVVGVAGKPGAFTFPVVGEVVGSGDGTKTVFTATTSKTPVASGRVVIKKAGTSVATDDGNGAISGTGVSGTVNYKSGQISVTFTAAPTNGQAITVDYVNDIQESEIAPIVVETMMAFNGPNGVYTLMAGFANKPARFLVRRKDQLEKDNSAGEILLLSADKYAALQRT